MRKILVPVDGSEHALRALAEVIKRHAAGEALEVHLLNVQIPVESGYARMFVSHEDLQEYYRMEGKEALRAARAQLDAVGVPYTNHVAVGHVAQTIVDFARERGCDEIVMGTHGRSALTHLLLGSVASDVSRSSEVPVTLVR